MAFMAFFNLFPLCHPADHLRSWFTPDRRKLISSRSLDLLAGRPLGTLSRFLSKQKRFTFSRSGLSHYYPFLALLGYQPPSDTLEPLNV